jgi:hypothetical protein
MLLGAERSILLIFNPTESAIKWTLPLMLRAARWESLLDSGSGTTGSAPTSRTVVVDPRTIRLLRVLAGARADAPGKTR